MPAADRRKEILELGLAHPDSRVAPVVSASFGVACDHPGRARGPERLIERADAALYEAKRGGRNRVVAAADPSD